MPKTNYAAPGFEPVSPKTGKVYPMGNWRYNAQACFPETTVNMCKNGDYGLLENEWEQQTKKLEIEVVEATSRERMRKMMVWKKATAGLLYQKIG